MVIPPGIAFTQASSSRQWVNLKILEMVLGGR